MNLTTKLTIKKKVLKVSKLNKLDLQIYSPMNNQR